MPIGKRPVPRVPRGNRSGSTSSGGTGGQYSGVSGSKSPTGARPTPRVARNVATPQMSHRKTSRPVKHTAMGSPKADYGTRGGGKGNGG